jgi:hypothetical protein
MSQELPAEAHVRARVGDRWGRVLGEARGRERKGDPGSVPPLRSPRHAHTHARPTPGNRRSLTPVMLRLLRPTLSRKPTTD